MTSPGFTLRAARAGDAQELTELANRAKAHWGYSSGQLLAWREDLTISAASIGTHRTLCAEADGRLVGVVQWAVTGEGSEGGDLLHLWVSPSAMGQGIGSALMDAAVEHARHVGLKQLTIDADPNAEAFYRSRGAQWVGEKPAPIEGQPGRVRPQLLVKL